jgi:hypothetical protein
MQYKLHSVVVTNGSHFKCLVKMDGTKWLHYDGLSKLPHFYITDISQFNQSQVINFQGEGYGIVSVFYIRDNDKDDTANNGNVSGVCRNVFESNNEMHSSSTSTNLREHILYGSSSYTSTTKETGKRKIDVPDIGRREVDVEDIVVDDNILPLTSIQIEKDTNLESKPSSLGYATRDTVYSEEEENEMDLLDLGVQIISKFVREKEPLYVGDMVEYYNPIFVYGDEQGKETASVTHIYSGRISISLNSNFTFRKEDRVRRIVGYNKKEKRQLRQDGLIRLVGDFELNNEQPDGNTMKIKSAAEVCDNIIENRTKRMKLSLKNIGNPYADFIVDKKNKRS